MKILVTGGAGYIGSFMTKLLLDRGHDVVVFDNLTRGHEDALDKRCELVKGDITNQSDVENIFKSSNFDAVMHFAGLIAVGESQEKPDWYYENNVTGSKTLFDAAVNIGGVNNFIFSSSAAVYGNPVHIPINEDHQKNPTSEYGKNKLEVEKILEMMRQNNQSINYACLRYFNAAGAALDGLSGEAHEPETHIIPLAMKAVLSNKPFGLFGTDYNTPDKTCIRDYIHVLDLVEAHILALEKIVKDPGGYYYNVGTGKGYSNRDVISAVEKATGKTLQVKEEPRRSGDSDQLVADPSRIKTDLGFDPKYSDLQTIVDSAWKWHEHSYNPNE